MYNISSLTLLAVRKNQLHGSLPPNLGFTLPNLYFLSVCENQFHGPLPVSVSNLTKLEVLYVDKNSFTGKVGIDFGGLSKLEQVLLSNNSLGRGKADDLDSVNTLTNSTSLQCLEIDSNQFGGVLPYSIQNLSTQLTWLSLGLNQISGDIPTGTENLVSLQYFSVSGNSLQGNIPTSLRKLSMLNKLHLDGNKFTGTIPYSLGNLTQLIELDLRDNHLQGQVPSSLGKYKYLLFLGLSGNNFDGIITQKIFDLFTLVELHISTNSFFGSLPSKVGQLANLEFLDVSDNMLFGEFPSTLGACTSLEYLLVKDNLFRGSIPSSVSSLKGLQELDLSHNNFSGFIPKIFSTFRFLQLLNLSFNHLEGEVPTFGVFANSSAISVIGNHKLCGGIPKLHLPTCRIQKSKEDGNPHSLKLLVIVCGCLGSLCLILMIFLFVIYKRRRGRKETNFPSIRRHHFKISYAQLLKPTNGFSYTNLIGEGSFGSVYKGVLNQGKSIVAVKVLNIRLRSASKSFTAECESLRNIRHRNLVRILTSCSSVDFEGNDFKALVFEFMSCGNLDRWLHPCSNDTQDELRHLNLVQRLNIAIDMATALEYLHHHCHTQIIHCDLKPSNILLDGDFTAHLGDFGISRILSKSTSESQDYMSSIGIKGSIGYIPPEYGAGANVSTQGDVYSFGILLLEMFTGKRPTHEMFKDNINLHSWTKIALHNEVIVDPPLLHVKEDGEETETMVTNINGSQRINKDRVLQCLNSIIRIGVECSAESPRDRMSINDVLKQLRLIRDKLS